MGTIVYITKICVCCVLFGICMARSYPSFLVPQCPENLVYDVCGIDCNFTCENPVDDTCNRKCVAKCQCPVDKPILHNGRCIEQSECTSGGKTPAEKPNVQIEPTEAPEEDDYFKCPETQVYQICGSKCNRTCEHGTEYPSCRRACVPRCGCPYERSYWHNGRCVTYDLCPKNKQNEAVKPEEEEAEKILKAEKEKRTFYAMTGNSNTDVLAMLGLIPSDTSK